MTDVITTARRPKALTGGARRRIGRRIDRGLTLFGVLMALGIASAAIIGALVLYNTAIESQARNEAQALLTSLVVATHQIHQGASNYGVANADLVPTLDRRGAIPTSARQPTSPVTIRHPFGDAVTVEVAAVTARFAVKFAALDPANCAMLLDPYIGQARGSGALWGVRVGTTALANPLTTAVVTNGCAGASNDVEFEFE